MRKDTTVFVGLDVHNVMFQEIRMPRRKQSKGQCAYCGYQTTKGSMSRHLATCPQRQERIINAEQKKVKNEKLYHLRVQDAWRSEFWLDLKYEVLQH